MAKSYQLLDSGGFRKLEAIGPYRIVRPAPQAIWPISAPKLWQKIDAEFKRESGDSGRWIRHNASLPKSFRLNVGDLHLEVYFTDFGHLGIFPEHHDTKALERSIAQAKPYRLLNLFAYTGYVSIKAALMGAEVVHVDSSAKSVGWAKTNAELSGAKDKPIRYIVDDVQKFVAKEARRGNKYQAIILDPPSFGRGAKNEVWKFEDDLPNLLLALKDLMAPDFNFLQLSAHSAGFSPLMLERLVRSLALPEGEISSYEMGIAEESKATLPTGFAVLYQRTL